MTEELQNLKKALVESGEVKSKEKSFSARILVDGKVFICSSGKSIWHGNTQGRAIGAAKLALINHFETYEAIKTLHSNEARIDGERIVSKKFNTHYPRLLIRSKKIVKYLVEKKIVIFEKIER